MKVKCDYCDNYFDEEASECPNCGAPNEHIKRTSNAIPRTIEELKKWAADHNMPLSQMHVYIGEDYRGPKAFGIYQDGEKFIVYKNKADGSRAVRYEGKDEAYAVNELYTKIKDLASEGKAGATSKPTAPSTGSGNSNKGGKSFFRIILIILAIWFAFSLFGSLFSSKGNYSSYDSGSYSYGSSYYDDDYDYSYDSGSSWFDDDDDDWGSSWDDDDWDSSWDSGSSYDWDSGSDWGSDW